MEVPDQIKSLLSRVSVLCIAHELGLVCARALLSALRNHHHPDKTVEGELAGEDTRLDVYMEVAPRWSMLHLPAQSESVGENETASERARKP